MSKLGLFAATGLPMNSQIVKRSVVVEGRKKHISLEEGVWRALKEIANYRNVSLLVLLATIDSARTQESLSSAARLFVLNFYREELETRDRHDIIEVALHSPIRLH